MACSSSYGSISETVLKLGRQKTQFIQSCSERYELLDLQAHKEHESVLQNKFPEERKDFSKPTNLETSLPQITHAISGPDCVSRPLFLGFLGSTSSGDFSEHHSLCVRALNNSSWPRSVFVTPGLSEVQSGTKSRQNLAAGRFELLSRRGQCGSNVWPLLESTKFPHSIHAVFCVRLCEIRVRQATSFLSQRFPKSPGIVPVVDVTRNCVCILDKNRLSQSPFLKESKTAKFDLSHAKALIAQGSIEETPDGLAKEATPLANSTTKGSNSNVCFSTVSSSPIRWCCRGVQGAVVSSHCQLGLCPVWSHCRTTSHISGHPG